MSYTEGILNGLLPQAPQGTEYRARTLHSGEGYHDTPFTCGGVFQTGVAPGKMRVANLSKATAVTIDCDFCDFPALLAMYGLEPSEESRKVVKGSLYALSEMEVRSMMDGMGFIPQAINGLCALGFPVAPNRVLYTGHGVNLIYWLPESIGWNDDSEWNLKRVKSIFSRLVEQHTPWFIDPSAKDVGTRIFPIPGHPHRRESAYKTIAVLDGGHDTVSDWDAILTTLDATLKKVKGARRSKTSKSKGKPTGEKVNWTYTRWNDAWEIPAEWSRLDACPACGGSGARREEKMEVCCWSCKTRWEIKDSTQDGFNVKLDMATGWAIWPDDVTEAEIWKTRTGTGKTHRFKSVIKQFKKTDRWKRKVVVVSPTVALAASLAARLNLPHAKAGGNHTLLSGDVVTCLAGMSRTAPAAPIFQAADYMIILDEVENMAQQFLSMLKGHKGREILNHLLQWVAFAGQVVLADAHAGRATLWLCEKANEMRKSSGLAPREWNVLLSIPHRFDLREVRATYRTSKSGREYVETTAEAGHFAVIMDDIRKERRVAIGCASKATANALSAEIIATFPKKNVQTVVGSTHDEDQQDLSAGRLQADVLVYTTAMGSGVSVDVKDWYYRRHIILGRSCPVDGHSVEQMLHRVRSPISPEIVISGGQGDPVTGQRTTAAWHQEKAKARVQADERFIGQWKSTATYRSDWRISDESEAMGDFQCALEAARYENGYRWVMAYLGTRHGVSGIAGGDAAEADAVKESVKTSKRAAKWTHAGGVAASDSLDEVRFEEVKNGTAKNEEEALAYEATIYERVYGDAWEHASPADRTQIAFNAKYKKGLDKNRLFAQVVCHLGDDEHVDALYNADLRRNDRSTFFEHKATLRTSAVIANLLTTIARTTTVTNETTEITNAVAQAALDVAKPVIKAAGVVVNACAADGLYIRPLTDILRLAGITLRVEKTKVNGRTVRRYYLDRGHVQALRALADAQIKRWLAPPPDPNAFKALRALAVARIDRRLTHNFRQGTP